MIKKAIVKSYSSSTHTATVQIIGSLSVWLSSIPVSRSIPPSEMQAARTCAVLFLDESNPDDAIIIAVIDTGLGIDPGGGAWEHIETIQLATDQQQINFTNLSTDYVAFRMLALLKRRIAGSPLSVALRFNNDTGNNYDYVDLQGDGTNATSSGATGVGCGVLGVYDDTSYGICFVYIQNLSASVAKEAMAFAGVGGQLIRNIANRWNNTSSMITKITLDSLLGMYPLRTGSWVTLEGCKKL